MLCNALALDNNFEVDTVMYLDDVNAFFNDTVLQGKPTDKYTGPEFHTLDERLQTEFVEFLTSLGIGEEVISFITVLSQDKDQRLYAKWLKDVAKFVSH